MTDIENKDNWKDNYIYNTQTINIFHLINSSYTDSLNHFKLCTLEVAPTIAQLNLTENLCNSYI